MAGRGPTKKGGPIPPGLRVTLVDGRGRTVVLTQTPTVIGRKNADVVVTDPTVSTRHAVIDRGEEGFAVYDEGSTNGTFVNGTKVDRTPKPVSNLDEIRFGDAVFTFNVVEDRYGMYTEEAAPATESSQTLLIASAPSVAPLPADQQVTLVAETGGAEESFRLSLRITTVGRSDGDVTVADPTLSKRHFQVEVHPKSIALKDLGSVNGTHLEGKPVSYASVKPGQVFTAGRTRFRIDADL